jgi:hypothetical protein
MKYYTEADHKSAVEWLYPNGQLDFSATILCSNNASVDMWNALVQGMKTSVEHTLRLKDSFSELDDPKGHLNKMLSATILDGFWKKWSPQSLAHFESWQYLPDHLCYKWSWAHQQLKSPYYSHTQILCQSFNCWQLRQTKR